MSRSVLASVALLGALGVGCSPKAPSELGKPVKVHGVVTDNVTRFPIAGATVTLLTGRADKDMPKPVMTGANGYFTFTEPQSAYNLLVQYEAPGYQTVWRNIGRPQTNSVNDIRDDIDLLDASQALTPTATAADLFTFAGWVYAGGALVADGQVVALFDNNFGAYVDRTTTMGGKFSFTKKRASNYTIRVYPIYGADAMHVAKYGMATYNLGQVDNGTAQNLTDIIINMPVPSTDLVAASFTATSAGYPISTGTLRGGVTGLLKDGTKFFLHFGSEVDTMAFDVQLRALDGNGNLKGILPIMPVTWESDVIATITPMTAIATDDTPDTAYQLRINGLRFQSGVVGFSPNTTDFGSITFDVTSATAPPTLANPKPTLFIANKSTATQTAMTAQVDASGVYVLDANGDYINGYSYDMNNGSGLQFIFDPVAMATGYRVWARNTLKASGSPGDDRLEWRVVNASFTTLTDTSGVPKVVATGVAAGQWSFFGFNAPGFGFCPWLYKNNVEFAITTFNGAGFESSPDPTQALALKDEAPAFITGSDFNYNDFGTILEDSTQWRGATLRKIFQFSFSEPMDTAVAPTLAVASGMLSIKTPAAMQKAEWNLGSPGTPVNPSGDVAIPLQLGIRTICTEVTADRTGIFAATDPARGDKVVPVRDNTIFAAAGGNKVAFFTPNQFFPSFDDELEGVVSANPLTFTKGLEGSVNQGDLACFISSTTNRATVSAVAGANLTVSDASLFYAGQQVMVYKPEVAEAGHIHEVLTVYYVDTTTKKIQLDGPVNAGQDTTSIVFPWYANEYQLRGTRNMSLKSDIAGGTGVKVALNSFGGGAPPLMIGDLVMFDADGDPNTTFDQQIVPIKAVNFVYDDPATVAVNEESFTFTVDLAAGKSFVHDVALVRHLGDVVTVSAVKDTSGGALSTKQDSVSGNGFIH